MSAERQIKAIVYGVGTIGKLTTRYMVEKGVDIVGAIDIANVGQDLGEVAGVGRPLNVAISDNADAILTKGAADVVMVSTFSQLEKLHPIFKKCLENNMNVITSSEEALYPWEIAPELALKLDKLAKRHSVTITGSGNQDCFRVNMIALLTGACRSVESVTVGLRFDIGQLGAATAVNYHIGDTIDEFHEHLKGKKLPLSSMKISLEALIADLGLTISKVKESVEPTIADTDIEAKCISGGIVRKGLVTGMAKITNIETEEGIHFEGRQILKACNKEERAEGPLNEVIIKGIPELHLKLQMNRIEENPSTIAQLVHRIPDVLNSKPGFVTIDKLPKLKYRVYPLQHYLNTRA